MADFRIIEEQARRDPTDAILSLIWNELATPYAPDSRLYDDLTAGQRAAYALTWIWAEVNNGGFHQCFYNSTAYLLPEAIEGARIMGSEQWAALLGRAARIFGPEFPRDRQARQRAVEAFDDSNDRAIRELDDDFYELDGSDHGVMDLIERYVDEHRGEFYRPSIDENEAAQALLELARDIISTDWRLRTTPRVEIESLLDEAESRAVDRSIAQQAQSLRQQVPFFKA